MSKNIVGIIADVGLWITIITLFSFSVANIAVILERVFYFRKNRSTDDRIALKIRDCIHGAKFDEAEKILNSNTSSINVILSEGVSYIKGRAGKKVETLPLELTLDSAISRERIRLERNVWALGTIGAIGPLVGLFGTVLGIMRSFAEISMRGNSAQGVVEVAAAGIWESLYTTAFGILVAVPALVAYNYFVKKSRIELDLLDNAANDIIAISSEYNEKAGK
jgi:biopolymer transport protein ExbB/TolQ